MARIGKAVNAGIVEIGPNGEIIEPNADPNAKPLNDFDNYPRPSEEHKSTLQAIGNLLGLGDKLEDAVNDDHSYDNYDFAQNEIDAHKSEADVARGAVKGVVSGIPQLYGLAGATIDYAANHAKGGNQTFADQLFKPGGIEAIMQEGEDFKQDYLQDNPNATVEELHQAYDDHRATPEYYNFSADQMRPGLSQGMKAAMAVNQLTGDQTTPDKENVLRQALEGIGSAILPLPGAGIIPKMAGDIAGRVGSSVAKVAQLALPGNPGGVGTAVVGSGIAAAIPFGSEALARNHHASPVLSRGMIDPRNGQVVTSAASMSDPVEMAHRGPPLEGDNTVQPAANPVVGTVPQPSAPITPVPSAPQSNAKPVIPAQPTIQQGAPQQSGPAKVVLPGTINQPEYQGSTPFTPGIIGGALAAVGGAAAAYGAAKYGRSAVQRVMGRTPVNVDAFAGQASANGVIRAAEPRAENIINSPAIRGSLNRPETATTLPGRILRAFDNAVNKDAHVEAQARDLGGNALEASIQAELGTRLSPGAKAAAKARAMHSGLMPDGTYLGVVPEEFYTASQALTQDQRDSFTRLIQGLNIQDRRTAGYNQLLNRSQEIATSLTTARGNARNNLQAEQQEVNRLMRLRNADDPSSRITFRQVPDEVINRNITEARQDPDIRRLEDMYRTISRNITRTEYNMGVLTQAEATSRYQNSHYSPLFEFEYKKKSDVNANNDLTDATMPDAAPERAIDPWSAIAFKLSNGIDDGLTNDATSRIITAFRASDPGENVVRPVDVAGNAGVVRVLNNGVPEYYQFARPAVAEALKASALDVGPALQAANKLRTLYQNLVTGPLAGTLYTPLRSVMFDAFATQATRRADRPFGLASYAAHRLATSPAGRRAADLIGAVDPTGPLLVTPYGFANAALMHGYQAAGERIAQMAQTQSPVFRALGNIPGGQQMLQNMGQRMTHAFDSSVVHLMENAGAVHTHQMVRDTLSVRNELEGFMRKYQNAGASSTALGRAVIDPTVSTLRTLYNGYSGLLNTIHNASRYGFAAQAYSILQHRAAAQGRAVTDAEIRQLAEEVRRSAGDLAGQPGSRLLKQFEVMTPYANISFQSARHVIKAMQRDPMQVGLTMIGLAGGMYGTYKTIMSRGKEAEDWYWNQANPWERVGALRLIPKPETMLHMAQNGGQLPAWNKHDPMGDFYEISISPELMPYVTTVMAGLEATGVMPRPNDATSIKKDMAFSLADSLAVGTQPLLNVPSIAITGQTINWTAGASGRAVMQPAAVARGSGAKENETLSGAPAWVPQMMTATMGLGGTMIYNAIDQGVQAYKDGQSFASIVQRVGLEGEEYLKERPAVPDIPLLYNAPAKVYRSTPASRRMSDLYTLVRGQLGKDRGLDAAWGMEFGKASQGPLSATAPHVQDIEVLKMMAAVHAAYLKQGAIKDQAQDAIDMKKDANDYQRQKVHTPVADISSGKFRYGLQSKLLDWQQKENDVLRAAEEFNDTLAKDFGDRFRKEKLPPTVEGVAALVARVARPLQPGERPVSIAVTKGKHSTLIFPDSTTY